MLNCHSLYSNGYRTLIVRTCAHSARNTVLRVPDGVILIPGICSDHGVGLYAQYASTSDGLTFHKTRGPIETRRMKILLTKFILWKMMILQEEKIYSVWSTYRLLPLGKLRHPYSSDQFSLTHSLDAIDGCFFFFQPGPSTSHSAREVWSSCSQVARPLLTSTALTLVKILSSAGSQSTVPIPARRKSTNDCSFLRAPDPRVLNSLDRMRTLNLAVNNVAVCSHSLFWSSTVCRAEDQ